MPASESAMETKLGFITLEAVIPVWVMLARLCIGNAGNFLNYECSVGNQELSPLGKWI